MDFDLNNDFSIFDGLLQKRPELKPADLKKSLTDYYLPYLKKLIDLKTKKNLAEGVIIGISAIQGAGKTTQGEILEVLLKHFGHSSVSRSIDDHYLTHRQLCELRNADPRFIRRGVTHDIQLAIRDLKDLQEMEDSTPILVSGYDKGAHLGDGDRFRWINPQKDLVIKAQVKDKYLMVNKIEQHIKGIEIESADFKGNNIFLPSNMGSDIPLTNHQLTEELLNFLSGQTKITITMPDEENVLISGNGILSVSKKDLPNGWRLITQKPDFIFYDGWMLGARSVSDESIFDQNLPALEKEDAKTFAKYVNRKLLNYEKLWEMLEFLNVLYVVNYENSLKWRDQAEETLRKEGEGMTHDEIVEFVHYFWRSVHPAIHIKNLARDEEHTNQVVIINDDHSVGEILTPNQVQLKYP